MAYSIAVTIAMFDKSLQNHLVSECINQSNGTVTTVNQAIHITVNNISQATQTADQIRKSCQSIFTPDNGWLIFGFFLFFLLTLCMYARTSSILLTHHISPDRFLRYCAPIWQAAHGRAVVY